jgi:hypothetical protein
VEQSQAYGEGHKVNENESSDETLIGVGLLAGLLLIALVLALIAGVEWYLNPQSNLSIVERRNLVQGLASAGQALAVALTGAVGLGGLFFTWRNTNQARESTRRTLELTEQGQITERFSKAIEQLGTTDEHRKKVLETRMGAIYALERIASESDVDDESIMEILTAYVRQHSPLKEAKDQDEEDEEEIARVLHAEPDIQAILDIIGRCSIERVAEYKRRRNLERTDLRDSDIGKANLVSVWFYKADLRGAFIRGAHLADAAFREADLRDALFGGTEVFEPAKNLIGTDFGDAILEGADLRRLDLTDAVGLTQSQIDQAYGDEGTRLPYGLRIPDHWLEERNA